LGADKDTSGNWRSPPRPAAKSAEASQPYNQRPWEGGGRNAAASAIRYETGALAGPPGAECPTDVVPENQGFSGNRSHWVSVCHVTSPLRRIPAGWTAAACPRQMNISGLNPSGRFRTALTAA
jgi:hypothetical protein